MNPPATRGGKEALHSQQYSIAVVPAAQVADWLPEVSVILREPRLWMLLLWLAQLMIAQRDKI